MSLEIHVDAHSSYKANERPRQFNVDEEIYEIEIVEDQWSLQSDFDGVALQSRPSNPNAAGRP